jgi:hypothetical protein
MQPLQQFLGYDVYDIDLFCAGSYYLRTLPLHTTLCSLILIEELDRYLQDGGDDEAWVVRVLRFMDGVGDKEQVLVFTMMGGKDADNQRVLSGMHTGSAASTSPAVCGFPPVRGGAVVHAAKAG